MFRSIQLAFVLVLVGFVSSAQPLDTLPKSRYRNGTDLIAPASLMLGGVLLNGNGPESIKKEIAEEHHERFGSFHTKIENYLQISPIVIAYGLDAAGVRSRTDLANRTAILLKGEILTLATTFALKMTTNQLRPDETDYFSFPSGHTAQAFAAATFLSEEYKHRFRWMPYAAYGIAGSVGVLRMANNKHYISDVLFGAGLGLLSMKISYWTHQYRWGKVRRELVVY